MTERQTAYLAALIAERPQALAAIAASETVTRADRAKAAFLLRTPTALTSRQASEAITWILDVPQDEVAAEHERQLRAPAPEVESGRYAIERDGVLRFYRVNRPTEGRWAGYTFVDAQASDEYHGIRNREERNSILAAIAVDPRGAMLRYGHELGRCGNCGRTLTDETSRAMGIGPECAQRLGLDRTPATERARRERVAAIVADEEQEAEGAVIVAEEEAAQAAPRIDYGSALRDATALTAGRQGPYTVHYGDDRPSVTLDSGVAAVMLARAAFADGVRALLTDRDGDTLADLDQ